MKRLFFVALVALAIIGSLSAQDWRPGFGHNRNGYAQNITVTGTLQLRNGAIVVENNNQFYYIPDLERYIGFIDGLKEGAAVTLDGYVYGNQAYTYIQPSKLTLNGKEYDFSANNYAYNGRGRGRNAGYGWCH
jgi:hypothetical protein